MADSFVRADKASQDVPRWVRVDQTLLTAAILNLAINARNAMPNGGTHETRRLGNTREGGSDGEAVRSADEIGLLAVELRDPFVVAGPRHDAPMALERVAEHRLVDDALGAGVECRRQLLQGLFPPIGKGPSASARRTE